MSLAVGGAVATRLRVLHRTGFRYDGPVTSSYNEARMTPLTDATQTTLDARVDVRPAATTHRYWDYWGTLVTAFDVHEPHDELVVTATSVVETGRAPHEPGAASWADLGTHAVTDRLAEWLMPTERTTADDGLGEVAQRAAGTAPTPAAAAVAAVEAIRSRMEYVRGATGVHTSAAQAWAERKGVCQDLAHVTLAVLRAMGVPARYVSGYLHPAPDAGIGVSVAGESHAWVEWWDGKWTAYDPTNGLPVGNQHVVVARGRDYSDVTPLKGVYSGPASSALGVVVEVTRLA